ncbi:MAG: hypothetical protein RL201_804, partial [Actinomycetota bacterium]
MVRISAIAGPDQQGVVDFFWRNFRDLRNC